MHISKGNFFKGIIYSALLCMRKLLLLQGTSDLNTCKDVGLKKIWEGIEPVWKMNNDDLIDIMAERIIYEDG